LFLVVIPVLLFGGSGCVQHLGGKLGDTPIGVSGWWLFLIWLFCITAETNRAPFDFAEGERELVSGFNVEYGGGPFAMIFIAEYARIIFIGVFTSFLFLGSSMGGSFE